MAYKLSHSLTSAFSTFSALVLDKFGKNQLWGKVGREGGKGGERERKERWGQRVEGREGRRGAEWGGK